MPADPDAELGHQNLISYSRAVAGWGSKGSYAEDGGALIYAGGSWLPVGCNGAFRLHPDLPATELVARADNFFASLGRGYSIKVRDTGQDADLQAACEAAGLVAFGEPVPHMVCLQPIADVTAPVGVEFRPVVDPQGVADFVRVNTDAYATYGMPADVIADLFDQPRNVLADADVHLGVAYLDDRPVAAALSYLSDGVGGIQWVGTVPDVRQMRLGGLVTQWANNSAFEHGAASCNLQASPMGAPLYLKLGYTTRYHYMEYVRWRAPSA
jgi:hypothetical protein